MTQPTGLRERPSRPSPELLPLRNLVLVFVEVWFGVGWNMLESPIGLSMDGGGPLDDEDCLRVFSVDGGTMRFAGRFGWGSGESGPVGLDMVSALSI